MVTQYDMEAAIRLFKAEDKRLQLALQLLAGAPELHRILEQTWKKYRMSMSEILSSGRGQTCSLAKHEFFYRALNETAFSSVIIGKSAGRDHTAVLYGAARHAELHGVPVPRGAANIRTRAVRPRVVKIRVAEEECTHG